MTGLSIPPCLHPDFVGKHFRRPVIAAVVSVYMDLRRLIKWVHPSLMSSTRKSKLQRHLSYAAVRSMKQIYILDVLIKFSKMNIALSHPLFFRNPYCVSSIVGWVGSQATFVDATKSALESDYGYQDVSPDKSEECH